MGPSLIIHQQFCQVGTRIIPPKLELHSQFPSVKLEFTSPEVQIKPGDVRIEIDKEAFWEDLGYSKLLSLAWKVADLGREAAYRAVARYSAEGDDMGQIENKEFSFADLVTAVWASGEKELNIGVLRPPQVRVQVRPLEVQGEPGHLKLQYIPADLRLDFQLGKLEVYLTKRPKVEVQVTHLDLQV